MKVKVNYYSLEPRMFIAGTKNSYGFEKLEFEFSAEWAGLDKTVTFYPADEDVSPVALMLTGSSVPIPREIMAHAGRASFTVSGYGEGKTLVSVSGYLDVIDANDPASDLADDSSEDYLATLISVARDAVNIAQSVRDDADNGVFDGEKGENGIGVSEGGTAGQFLVKKSDDDYDVEWRSPVKILRDVAIDSWDCYDDEDHIYQYYHDIRIEGVTSSSCVDVYFHPEDIAYGVCPVCTRLPNFIRVFAKEDLVDVEIPMIRIMNV